MSAFAGFVAFSLLTLTLVTDNRLGSDGGGAIVFGIALAFVGMRVLRLGVRGFASSGLPGPKGNRETFVWCGGEGPTVDDLEAALLAAEAGEA